MNELLPPEKTKKSTNPSLANGLEVKGQIVPRTEAGIRKHKRQTRTRPWLDAPLPTATVNQKDTGWSTRKTIDAKLIIFDICLYKPWRTKGFSILNHIIINVLVSSFQII